RVDLAVAQLHRGVAVGVGRPHRGDDTGARLDDGDGHHLAVVGEDLGHAELGAQDSLDLLGHNGCVPQSLISMSTPAGRSSRIRESTVFGVGSMVSVRRLCVRMTQYTFFSVGSGTGPATFAPVRVTVSTIFRAELSMTSWSYALSRMRIFCPAIVASVPLLLSRAAVFV